MQKLVIKKNDEGQRVDKFLTKFFKSKMPTSMIYKSIRKKRIKINGKKTENNYILKENDIMELYINDEFFTDDEKKVNPHVKADFKTIYEDENIILIDKKAGIVVHDDSDKTVNTLVAQLISYLKDKGEYDETKENSFVPALCNRIDRNTSGIVIGAKNAQALREMNEIIKLRRVKKIYLAKIKGKLNKKSDTLTGYLFKDSKQNKVYITKEFQKGSSKIITKYNVKKEYESETLAEVELVTGKTHQIRAHFASIGHPLVGDGKYGKLEKNERKFQALHAYKLIFDKDLEYECLGYLKGKTFVSNSADFL